MKTRGALLYPEAMEKPSEKITKGQYPSEDMKNFGEAELDVGNFFVSEEIWTASWKKYSEDVKILRTIVRRQLDSRK